MSCWIHKPALNASECKYELMPSASTNLRQHTVKQYVCVCKVIVVDMFSAVKITTKVYIDFVMNDKRTLVIQNFVTHFTLY